MIKKEYIAMEAKYNIPFSSMAIVASNEHQRGDSVRAKQARPPDH